MYVVAHVTMNVVAHMAMHVVAHMVKVVAHVSMRVVAHVSMLVVAHMAMHVYLHSFAWDTDSHRCGRCSCATRTLCAPIPCVAQSRCDDPTASFSAVVRKRIPLDPLARADLDQLRTCQRVEVAVVVVRAPVSFASRPSVTCDGGEPTLCPQCVPTHGVVALFATIAAATGATPVGSTLSDDFECSTIVCVENLIMVSALWN
jgi:hypothetical protein